MNLNVIFRPPDRPAGLDKFRMTGRDGACPVSTTNSIRINKFINLKIA